MPITLGILAQSREVVAAGDFVLLETQVLSGSQASITFSSLNTTYGTTYKHLQVRFTARTDRGGQYSDPIYVSINGSTASEYATHRLRGDGSTVTSANATATGFPTIEYAYGPTAPANVFAAGVVDILDPFVASKNRTLRILHGGAGPTSGNEVLLTSIARFNTAAIDSITFDPIGQFVQHSRFSLYGVK